MNCYLADFPNLDVCFRPRTTIRSTRPQRCGALRHVGGKLSVESIPSISLGSLRFLRGCAVGEVGFGCRSHSSSVGERYSPVGTNGRTTHDERVVDLDCFGGLGAFRPSRVDGLVLANELRDVKWKPDWVGQ